MTNMFVTTSFTSLGCTFVEWSINYLTGNDSYYKIWPSHLQNKNGTAGYIPLVDNPLTGEHAHKHRRNHPAGVEEAKYFIGLLRQQKGGLKSCYPTAAGGEGAEETTQIIDYCLQESIPVVFVTLPKDLYLFSFIGNRAGILWVTDNEGNKNLTYVPNPIDRVKSIIPTYFMDSFKEWKSDEVWDVRELLALNLYEMYNASNQSTSLLEDIQDSNFHRVSGPMLWHAGEDVFPEIFRKLDLELDEERFLKWKPVYSQWQVVLRKQIIDFYYSLDFIVDSIVHNLDLDLSQFNMSLTKEIVIQAELIKNHNLTIKGWGLEKFPDNATDLHKLLEESFYDA